MDWQKIARQDKIYVMFILPGKIAILLHIARQDKIYVYVYPAWRWHDQNYVINQLGMAVLRGVSGRITFFRLREVKKFLSSPSRRRG